MVDVVVEVAASSDRECLDTADNLAAGVLDGEHRKFVMCWVGKVHPHATEGLDRPDESTEAHHDDVVDGNAEVGLDGSHQEAGVAISLQVHVDAVELSVGRLVGNELDERVSRDRDHRDRVGVGVDVEDLHDVGPLSRD